MNTRQNLRILLALTGFNVLPHLNSVSFWVGPLALLLWLWRWAQVEAKMPELGRPMKTFIVVALAVTVVFHHQKLWGQAAATDLLVLMAVAKTFEIRIYRDVMVLAYLCFYLLMAKALESQSVVVTLFLVLDVFLIVSVLAYIHSAPKRRQLGGIVRQAVSLSLLGVPIAILLFIIFPRFNTGLGPFASQNKGRTGISDELKPGQLAELMLSDAIVFRASINQANMNQSNLYWRGTILDVSEGLNWKRGSLFSQTTPKMREYPNPKWIKQDIFIEPTEDRWLFGLDYPAWVKITGVTKYSKVTYDNRGYFSLNHRLYSKLHYQIWSDPAGGRSKDQPDPSHLVVYPNPEQTKKTYDWISEMKLRGQPAKTIVRRLLHHFQSNGFVYSLQPGTVLGLDDFLFETKKGFCEHYAASLGTLLRILGVPSRVVVGFQGGTPSLAGDYFIVRELDAHAWVEYWDKGEWVRVDPVAVIAPGRIELGRLAYDEYLAQKRAESLNGGEGEWSYDLQRYSKMLYYRTLLVWDQLDAYWVNFLMRFDLEYQRELLRQILTMEFRAWQLLLIVMLLFVLLLVRAYYQSVLRVQGGGSERIYRLFCYRMKRWGLERQNSEGPLDFCQRIQERYPRWGDEIANILKPIFLDRYGNQPMPKSQRPVLILKIMRLRPPKNASEF